jgi:hypothetical protein
MRTAAYYESNPEDREKILPAIGKTPRQIQIDLGTPAIRQAVFEGTWVEYLMHTHKPDEVLIIPDVRFPNEVNAIRERGGFLFKIENPRVPITHDVADDAISDYENWDYRIVNDGTIDDLRTKLQPVVAAIMERV